MAQINLLTRVALVISCLISCGDAAPARAQSTEAAGKVKVTYDQAQNVTRITLDPIILISRRHEELRLGVAAAHPGERRQTPAEVALVFVSLSATGDNRYENSRSLAVVADQERLALGETQRAATSQNSVAIETLSVAVPFDKFARIARAEKVQVKLGFTSLTLTPEQITSLRAAAAYMAP